MPRVRLSLSIGYAAANREDFEDIPDDEWNDMETDQEKEDYLQGLWAEWSNNYIDGGFEIVKED